MRSFRDSTLTRNSCPKPSQRGWMSAARRGIASCSRGPCTSPLPSSPASPAVESVRALLEDDCALDRFPLLLLGSGEGDGAHHFNSTALESLRMSEAGRCLPVVVVGADASAAWLASYWLGLHVCTDASFCCRRLSSSLRRFSASSSGDSGGFSGPNQPALNAELGSVRTFSVCLRVESTPTGPCVPLLPERGGRGGAGCGGRGSRLCRAVRGRLSCILLAGPAARRRGCSAAEEVIHDCVWPPTIRRPPPRPVKAGLSWDGSSSLASHRGPVRTHGPPTPCNRATTAAFLRQNSVHRPASSTALQRWQQC